MPHSRQPLENHDRLETSEQQTPGLSFSRVWPLLLIVAGIVGFFVFDLDRFLSFQSLSDNRQFLLDWYNNNQWLAFAIYFMLYAICISFSLPGGVWLTLAGGFIFGTIVATLITVAAATVGATIIFLIARYALADFFHAKAGRMGHCMEEGFQECALSYLLFLRLVPVFPFWLVNLVPALLGVPLRTYVIGTFFGIIPGTAVFASVGNGLGSVFDSGGMPDMNIIFEPQILFPILALAVLSLVPVIHKKMSKRKKENP